MLRNIKELDEGFRNLINEEISNYNFLDIFIITDMDYDNYTADIKQLNHDLNFKDVSFSSILLGHGKGLLMPPSINDIVLVGFLNGNLGSPIILGCIFDKFSNNPDTILDIRENEVYLGNKVNGSYFFIDEDGNVRINLEDGSYFYLDGLKFPSGLGVAGQILISDGNGNLVWGANAGIGIETDPIFTASDVFGVTTSDISNWDDAYTKRVDSWTGPLAFTSNTASIDQADTTTDGYLSSTDWNNFNNKVTESTTVSDTNTVDLTLSTYDISADVLYQNSTTIDLSDDVSGLKADLNSTLKSNYDDAYTKRVDTWGDGLQYGAQTASVDYNTTNLKITSTELNTIQDISITSSPTFNQLTINNTPTTGTNVATKDYVDNLVEGLDWQESVLDQLNFVTSEPTGQSTGDRYINTATGDSSETTQAVTADYIYEWNGVDWSEIIPDEGSACWIEDEDTNYVYYGGNWVKFGNTVTHNNTSGLQGGTSSEYYHLTSAQHTEITTFFDNTDFTYTEAETLSDGSNADALHVHTMASGISDEANYLLADGTRALTSNWDAGSYKITAETFESDVATGTSPFTVASTTLVSNLNADLLDGQEGSYYQIAGDYLEDGDFTSNGIMLRTAEGVYDITADNSSDWDAAYGWGDHSSAGYVKADGTVPLTANWDVGNYTITANGLTLNGTFTDGTMSISSGALTSGKYASFTVANTENDVVMSLTQNDITNNPDALDIINIGTGNGIHINQSGNGRAVYIENSGNNYGIRINQNDSLGNGLRSFYVYSNADLSASGNGDTQLVKFLIDNASSDKDVLKIQNDGTGACLHVDPNGNATNGAVYIDNTGNTNYGLYITSAMNGDVSQPMVQLSTTNGLYDAAVINISNAGVNWGIEMTTAAAGISVTNTGTGNCIRLDPNGNATNGAFYIENTGNTNQAMYLYSNLGATANQALVEFKVDNSAFDQNVLTVTNDGVGQSAYFAQNGILAAYTGAVHIYSNAAHDQSSSALLRIRNDNSSSAAKGMYLIQDGSQQALYVENNGTNAGIYVAQGGVNSGLYVYSNVNADATSPLVNFIVDNVAFDNPVINIQNDGIGASITDGTATWNASQELTGFTSISTTSLTVGSDTVTSLLGTRTIVLSAAGAIPSTTSGASGPTSQELTTNDVMITTFNFDKDVDEYIQWEAVMPDNWDGSTITAVFYWSHAATVTNFDVVWGLQARAYADGDALDQTWGTAQTVTDTGGTADDNYISSATSAITVGGSPAAGQKIIFRAFRDADNVSDNLDVDARLHSIKIEYGITSLTS